MDFDIHKVKSVKEVYCNTDAQEQINNGWTLLCVYGVNNGEAAEICYVLGSYDEPKKHKLDEKFEELSKEFPNL